MSRGWAEKLVLPYPSFRDFVMDFLSEEAIRNAYHFRPQWSYLCVLPKSLPEIDFIGRFETISEVLKPFGVA